MSDSKSPFCTVETYNVNVEYHTDHEEMHRIQQATFFFPKMIEVTGEKISSGHTLPVFSIASIILRFFHRFFESK